MNPSDIMKVTPFSTYVYGFLVLVLITGIVFLWRELIKAQSQKIATMENTSGVLHQVAEHLKAESTTEALVFKHDTEVKLLINEKFNTVLSKLDKLK